MTEYDYSPEAYQRHLATQQRIGKWVDKTEGCRKQFANPFTPPPTHMPGFEEPRTASRHSPHSRRSSQNNSRSSSPGHSSGDDGVYGRGPYAPGPMNPMRSAPGHLSNFPQHQLPFQQSSPLPSPPAITSPQSTMPPSYYGTPSIQQVKAHRKSQPRHFAPPPPLVLSPPVSPGGYGQPSPTGYVMVPPQMGRPMQMMSPPLPNSAPAHITTFSIPSPAPPPTPPAGYFQVQQHPHSFSSLGLPQAAPSPVYMQGVPAYAYSSSSAGVSPPHSAFQEMYGFTPMVSPPPGHAYLVSPGATYAAPIPQVAVASPTTPATSPYSYVYPSTALHQRVYDMTGQNRHTLRRSVG